MSINCFRLREDIVGIVKFSLSILFGSNEKKYKFNQTSGDEVYPKLYKKLIKLIDDGDINEAENLLIENETDDISYLELMLATYLYINELSDEQIKKSDYTREEIYDGVIRALKKYNSYHILSLLSYNY